jgi:protein-S-isoprenylcysteine O-methyltransferase Ste14
MMSRTAYLAVVAATRLLTDLPLLWMFIAIHIGWPGAGRGEDALRNALALTAWAVLHSVLARSAGRRALARWVGAELVRVSYVMIAGVTLAAVLFVWRPVSGELWHATGALAWLLTVLYVALLVGLVWVTLYFDYAEFLGLRQLARGTRGEPPGAPVFSAAGPYGYCRHPMYLAMLAAFWVGPIMSASRLEFAALATLYLFVGLRFEERNLRQELGQDYDRYCASVPMLIPRLVPWRPSREVDPGTPPPAHPLRG